ncbi:MAG: hypothetical protein LBD89_01955, partial [Tannerellaceae bacterium]|nr:hypothetical protein [Tannerellaceae bacterium]
KRNLLLALLCFLWGNFAGLADNISEAERKKVITQSFPVTMNDRLRVENRYGEIAITHWAKNEVSIRVEIESKARNERMAQEIVDNIRIELKKSGNTVHGITTIPTNNGWGSHKLTINYYITMPSRLTVDLSVRYGGINLPEENEGRCNLEIKYGDFKAGNFTQPLILNAAYSQIQFGNASDLQMDVEYCGSIRMKSLRTSEIESKYSNIQLHNADKLILRNLHDNVRIEDVAHLSLEAKYSKVRIRDIKEKLLIAHLDYSTMTIEKLAPDFGNAQIETRYSTLRLSISSKASFRVVAQGMRYGSINVTGLKITESTSENKSSYSYWINGGGDNLIRFEGHYSHLRITDL